MKSLMRSRVIAPLAVFMAASALLLAVPEPASAGFHILPECARRGAEVTSGGTLTPPGLPCALETFRNVARLILGVTGSFALLFFVYGGFMVLTSAGNESRVSKGKEILRNAVIGIFIIFTAGYLIDYGYRTITAGSGPPALGTSCSGGTTQQRGDGSIVCIPDTNGCGQMSYGTGDQRVNYTCHAETGPNCVQAGCGSSPSTPYCCPVSGS
jgi:hypothetical protein